jgi:hypothetical protein
LCWGWLFFGFSVLKLTRFERTPRLDGHGDIVGLAYLPRDREDGVAELDFLKNRP